MFKNSLVSVSDKSEIANFILPLHKSGMRVVSTGGTAKLLKEAGVEVIDVSEQTGHPEVMDGRVKTLHPKVHMALLAREGHSGDADLLKEQGLEPFDLVVGNLYPFSEALKENLSLKEQVEFIDIGGPSFLRAAAKSFDRIAVVCDPADYQMILEKKELTIEDRKMLAAKVFAHTSQYDSIISSYLISGDSEASDQSLQAPAHISQLGDKVSSLRYGENPGQKAIWMRDQVEAQGLHSAEKIQGKELSYNNLLDLEAAVQTLREWDETCCVSVKHNNPCGVGFGADLAEAVERSLAADPVSVFGGIIAMNEPVTGAVAEKLKALFLECVIAPDYMPEALEVLAAKKNLRVLKWPEMMAAKFSTPLVKSVLGGYLLQDRDVVLGWQDSWQVHGEQPNEQMKRQLVNTWKLCAHLKSNAIAIAGPDYSVGLGMGQVNRVDAVEQAVSRWGQFHSDVSQVVLASDAFFPFPDSIEKASAAGISWVIQPGGSIKDPDVIAKAKELGVNMVLTGQRHFYH
ncbi:MAG: bifunctional phosphoribosylaminoimidazolecarboxamide formyltransferase/IMP cyclohydrolase [Bdellovibrionales bacterium]|nr:bifunctional phosphoribosylaminoimidazolecarboxamide formyltransferase/IMP cyclohydrolase [Bdellovibrionales bacterium]